MAETLKDKLFYQKKTVYELCSDEVIDAAYAYAEDYKKFLDHAKTERDAVSASEELAKNAGFRKYELGDKIEKGGKYYFINRGKNIFLFRIGTEPIENGIRIAAAHIDSPRLDLKPCPLYEDGGLAMFKTHYYGGIRKYQWPTIPLAFRGVIVKADGTPVDFNIGEDAGDPQFYIDDLLPHLGREQSQKPLGTAIPAEKLNVVVGSRPVKDEDGGDLIKLNIMKLLNEKYGITEEDFLSAEVCAVPAAMSRDIGFDRSLVGGYGHDDKVCAYPSLTAIIESKNTAHTLMTILVDKEEIGSEGVSGMQNDLLVDLMDAIATELGGRPAIVRAHSKCLSSDVTANYDPNFADAFEIRNSSIINCGISMCKYTGSGGKGGSNDASAEFVGWVRRALASEGVVWQMAELGKVDFGGGGTVAKYIAKHNIDTVDMGVGVLAMHAPYELISKVDLYEAHRAFTAFYDFE